ncbi:uncharacterized protein EV420DRAFT_1654625 [Desarmillaria tabescens]|uniref:Uncharacterized protein n=1 Tax=Armillaria tabescens TaxID=1929756 RepID=A0AA39MG08_ARMTA|nr:uncharacterized protein EV420DRAFT_1654625 [Desarmillaria tabescens]KAK0433486.1 hypothetical protein EV420DRAFT_1654625 [Desarmillaria tabescens]
MEDPSHLPEEERAQSQDQDLTPATEPRLTSQIPGAYSTTEGTHPYTASSMSLQSEETSQEAKKRGLWNQAREVISTFGTKKEGGSKASSRTTAARKKNLTVIPETSGPEGKSKEESPATTLNKMMESLVLGPPPQLPPVQLSPGPLDQEWWRIAGQRTEGSQSPGTQPPPGSSQGKKLLWPEYQPWGPRQSPPKRNLPEPPSPMKRISRSETRSRNITPIELSQILAPTNSPSSPLSPRASRQERSNSPSPSTSDHGHFSTTRSSSPSSSQELPGSPQTYRPEWTEQERTTHKSEVPKSPISRGYTPVETGTSPLNQTPPAMKSPEESGPSPSDTPELYDELERTLRSNDKPGITTRASSTTRSPTSTVPATGRQIRPLSHAIRATILVEVCRVVTREVTLAVSQEAIPIETSILEDRCEDTPPPSYSRSSEDFPIRFIILSNNSDMGGWTTSESSVTVVKEEPRPGKHERKWASVFSLPLLKRKKGKGKEVAPPPPQQRTQLPSLDMIPMATASIKEDLDIIWEREERLKMELEAVAMRKEELQRRSTLAKAGTWAYPEGYPDPSVTGPLPNSTPGEEHGTGTIKPGTEPQPSPSSGHTLCPAEELTLPSSSTTEQRQLPPSSMSADPPTMPMPAVMYATKYKTSQMPSSWQKGLNPPPPSSPTSSIHSQQSTCSQPQSHSWPHGSGIDPEDRTSKGSSKGSRSGPESSETGIRSSPEAWSLLNESDPSDFEEEETFRKPGNVLPSIWSGNTGQESMARMMYSQNLWKDLAWEPTEAELEIITYLEML